MNRQLLKGDPLGPLVVDSFAGGGGASTGISLALGRSVDIAINHDAEALAIHAINHPDTRHYCEDVFAVDPVDACEGRPVALMWLSPDCKEHSKAKGGKPRDKNIRGLAWVAIKWAQLVAPRVIMLENVEEFQLWGPLLESNQPDPERKGETFREFVGQLEVLGYQVEWRELRGCDYGAPTIRKRLFLIARLDGQPIVWPEPTHGHPKSEDVLCGRLFPWIPTHHHLDFSLPTTSIFEKEYAESTMARIFKGLKKWVIEAEEPFIIYRGEEMASAFLTEHANASQQRTFDIQEPLRTQCAEVKGGHFAQVTAYLAKHYTGAVGSPVTAPLHIITTVDHNALVVSHLEKFYSTASGASMCNPLPTITSGGNHIAEVRTFLCKYYGQGGQDQDIRSPLHTITTKGRFGLVEVHGVDYQIVDIRMRMLQPRELYSCQGFPDNYIIDPELNGKCLSKEAQIRMVGNSVVPQIPEALVRANCPELCLRQQAT